MSYNVKNKMKRPLVCSLKDNSTLRLAIGEQKTIEDNQVNDYLKNLSSKGLLVLSKVETKTTENKKATVGSKEKEVK